TVETSTKEKVCISLSQRPTAPIAYRQTTNNTVDTALRVACQDSSATRARNSQGGTFCMPRSTGSRIPVSRKSLTWRNTPPYAFTTLIRWRFTKSAADHSGKMPSRVCGASVASGRSEEHTSELQSRENLVCRLLLEK